MKTVRAALPVIAVVIVLSAYAFYGSVGTFDFPRVSWDRTYSKPGEGYYSSLAEARALGVCASARTPLIRLRHLLPSRRGEGRWKEACHERPSPLHGEKVPKADEGCGRRLRIPFTIWVLLIGFGNLVPLILIYVRVYEVAIIAGMALSATWAYALVRFMQTGTVRQAFWMGFWLALAIAARPNLLVLLLITAFALPWRRWRTVAACFAPLVVIGLLVAAHNYVRFQSPAELGVTYQLTFTPMRDHRVCSLCKGTELLRFMNNTMHYVAWAPPIRSNFPYADFGFNRLDPLVSFPGVAEPMVGIGPVNPLTMIATLLAVIVFLSRRPLDNSLDNGTRGGLSILLGAWLVLFGLSTCWYVIVRYVLDFSMLMTVGSVVAIEAGLSFLDEAGVKIRPLRAGAIVLALFSILFGIFLGFTGPQRAFEMTNPEMYRMLFDALALKR